MARRNLPEEVITEILSWLPVKSLMRFKCVSKPWLHLISTDTRFINLHFNRSSLRVSDNSNPSILVVSKTMKETQFYYAEEYTSCNKLTRFEIPFPHLIPFDFKLVNVCNGLVCLTDFLYQRDHPKAYIWNPLTGDHIILPSSPNPSHSFRKEYEDGVRFREINVMYGFGFNQASDEHKVIQFVSTSPEEQIAHQCQTHVSVYTLGTDSSWRTLPNVPYNVSLSISSTALVNGALHWFGFSLSKSDGMYPHDTLIAFNIQDEMFHEIQQPDAISSNCKLNTKVGVWDGLLCIFSSLVDEYLEVWVMRKYGVADSWRKHCKIVHPWVSGNYMSPVGVADNGEIIISRDAKELFTYDPKTNSVRGPYRFEFHVFGTHTFKGSILSPTIINGASRLAK